MDLARWQGGWGRVRYAAQQLVNYSIDDRLTQALVDTIPKWNAADRLLQDKKGWLNYLERQGVFFSSPLDLDLMMIEAFPEAYAIDAALDLVAPDADLAKAVFGKKHDVFADQYTAEQQQLFDAYHDRFKLGSKPSNHVKALAVLEDVALMANVPAVLSRMISLVETKLEALPE